MPSNSLIFRFIGIDDGASAQFDRLAAKSDMTAVSFKKFGLGAAVAFGVVAVASIDMASKFQASTELIHTQAGVSQAGVDAMRKSILGLAGDVGTAPEALSEAMFHIASTGQRGAAALNELRIAAEGAKVGGADLTDVTNALNATIVSGISGAGNFGHAMGALNAIVGAGDMHMEDLAQALGSGVLVVMKTFGVNLTQVGAALAVFGDNNIRGAQAATYLRMTVQAISKPSIDADTALGKINLTVNQLQNSLAGHGLTGVLDLLHSHFEASGIDANKWGDVLEDAFTKKAGTGLTILLEEFGRYQLKQAEVAEGAKNFGADWSATTSTLSFQFDRFRADVDSLAISFGDDLIPVALGALRAIEEVGDAVKATAEFFIQHKAVTIALAGALTGALLPALIKTGAAMGASAIETFALTMMYAKDAVVGLWAAEDTAKDSTLALEASFGPLGVALAVVGAVAGVMWEKNREATEKAKQAVVDYDQSLHATTTSLASQLAAASQLESARSKVLATVTDAGVSGSAAVQHAYQVASVSLSQYDKAIAAHNAIARTLISNETKIGNAYGLNRAQVERLAAANNIDLTGSLQSIDTGFAGLTTAATLSKSPLKDANSNFQDMAADTTTASQGVTDLGNAFDDLVGNFVGMKQAQVDFKNDLVATISALKKSHDSISLNSKDSRGAASAYYSLVSQIETVTSATYTSSKSYDAAKNTAKAMLGQLEELPIKGPAVRKIIQGLKADIAGMGGAAESAGKQVGAGLDKGLIVGIDGSKAEVLAAAHSLSSQVIKNLHEDTGVYSPSLKTRYIGEMLAQGLIDGWTGEAEKIKNALTTPMQNALNHLQTVVDAALTKQKDALKAAQSALKSELATRKSDIASLAGTISGGADLSNIFGTDANGNATMGNAAQFLASQVGPLKQEADILKKLKARHLKAGLLSEIANLPVNEAIQVGNQFLSGQSSIVSADASYAAIQQYSTASATTVTDSLLKNTILKDRDAVKEQTQATKELTKRLDRILREAAHNAAENLNVTITKGGGLKLSREDAKEIERALNEYRKNVKGHRTLTLGSAPK